MNLLYHFVLAASLAAPFFCETAGRECNAESQDCVEELASVSLLQTDLTVSQISPHRDKDVAKMKGVLGEASKTSALSELQSIAMLQHSTHPLPMGDFPAVAKEMPAAAVLEHSPLGIMPQVAQLQQTAGSSSKSSTASLYLAHAHKMLQRMSTGNGAVVMVVLLTLLAFFLVCCAAGGLAHIDPWGWYRVDKLITVSTNPAQDMLAKPGQVPPQPPLRNPADPRIPPIAKMDGQPGRERSVSNIQPASSAQGVSSIMSSLFGGQAALLSPAREQAPVYLMPELVVQEPEGAQYFFDGLLSNTEQNSVCSVWKISATNEHQQVIKVQMSEGLQGGDGHQNGIVLELPRLSSMPLAFINTQFAIPRPVQGHHAVSQNRHCTIFDTFNHGLSFKDPFATVEKEARGVTLRRVTGEVICIVTSGGYNADFGNIVDDKGRLLATLSNRGHGMNGLGMVRGQWKENRRAVQVAQGCDVSIIASAIICAAKLL